MCLFDWILVMNIDYMNFLSITWIGCLYQIHYQIFKCRYAFSCDDQNINKRTLRNQIDENDEQNINEWMFFKLKSTFSQVKYKSFKNQEQSMRPVQNLIVQP